MVGNEELGQRGVGVLRGEWIGSRNDAENCSRMTDDG